MFSTETQIAPRNLLSATQDKLSFANHLWPPNRFSWSRPSTLATRAFLVSLGHALVPAKAFLFGPGHRFSNWVWFNTLFFCPHLGFQLTSIATVAPRANSLCGNRTPSLGNVKTHRSGPHPQLRANQTAPTHGAGLEPHLACRSISRSAFAVVGLLGPPRHERLMVFHFNPPITNPRQRFSNRTIAEVWTTHGPRARPHGLSTHQSKTTSGTSLAATVCGAHHWAFECPPTGTIKWSRTTTANPPPTAHSTF